MFLLLENGDRLLLESGDGFLLETSAPPSPPGIGVLLLEDGFSLLLETGAYLLLEDGGAPPTPPPEEPRAGAYMGSESAFAFQGVRPRRKPRQNEAEEIVALLALIAARS